MKTRGSITVFFSLLLTVIISLISAFLVSAKIAAGRAQIAIAADQVIYSQMARYDSELFDMYHLFFLDAGYDSDTLHLGKILDELESDLSYLFMPNKEVILQRGIEFLKLQEESGSITGYTLATDCDGKVLKEQAVQYMKDTLGIQSVSLLYQKLTGQENIAKQQETMAKAAEEKGKVEEYEEIKRQSVENRNVTDSEDNEVQKQSVEEERTAIETTKTLDAVQKLRKTSILNLVIQDTDSLSGWSTDIDRFLSKRSKQQGMGLLEVGENADGIVADILFQEYILKNLNHYQASRQETGPSYGVEYVLQGKNSDVKNLEGIANKMLLLRMGANVSYLYTDAAKRAEVQSLALTLSSFLLLPEVSPAIENILITAWAFVESLVDVRGIFAGDKVPFIKTVDSWQVNFSDIPKAISGIDSFRKDSGGYSYEDYLRLFLFMRSDEKKVIRCMDVIELSIREIPGKEEFSLDCAIDTLEVQFEVRAESRKTFTIVESESYRNL